MNDVQAELSLLVPLEPIAATARIDAWEKQLVQKVGQQWGLSKSEVIRRCIRHVKLQLAQHAGCPDFLVNPQRLSMPVASRNFGGRKPRGRKISDLKKNIATTLRALESQQRELAALEAREVRAA